MSVVHFLNVLEGDCNIIEHDTKRVTVIDVSNAYNDDDTEEEKEVKLYKEKVRKDHGVPLNKRDFGRKEFPDNPISYMKDRRLPSVFRFIVTHPDMDHLDGIEDFFKEFPPSNVWDTNNTKKLNKNPEGGKFNANDWSFYSKIRDGKLSDFKRLTLYSGSTGDFYTEDRIKILAPTPELVKRANEKGDHNDLSYVLLFTAPKKDNRTWKILFAGDSHDDTWDHIMRNHKADVSNIDVLFAPHHGRDSARNYSFLDILKPKLVLFGNASSEHLAYNSYSNTGIRITNNQAGYVVLDLSEEALKVYVENKDFANQFRNNVKKGRDWGDSEYNKITRAYFLCRWSAK